ncbi:Ig-like domain-containing protein [Clostridium sp. VAP51]|uniref:Ig-like domain-containing protein n=1 Tax=Clostridium sp. VAP51 TaxID=2949978 RepID=UPI002079E33D|nr:Ig-like domain-containing protein [Clostridium sp. VAP51]
MKNCFKRILIMFVMVLTIMGVGIFQNGIIANAATVGESLKVAEDGWKRIDDKKLNNYATKNNSWTTGTSNDYYDKTYTRNTSPNEEYSFRFYGDKFRLITCSSANRSTDTKVYIDDVKYNVDMTQHKGNEILIFQELNLEKSVHTIKFISGTTNLEKFILDAIDIDEDGYLIDINDISLTLDKSLLNLKENSSKKLTATTTPSAVEVEWSSSDTSIATVDENGKVTGVKEGTCTVRAQIKGTDVKAICEVTVTKEDKEPEDPEEPSIENGSLYIEMVDGNIKRADKSQIEKFKKWFISRDLDETESPIFKITNAKGNVEYLVHDKIVGFEIREN